MAGWPIRAGEGLSSAATRWPRVFITFITGCACWLVFAAGCAHTPQSPQRPAQVGTDGGQFLVATSSISIAMMATDAIAQLRELAAHARGSASKSTQAVSLASLEATWAVAPSGHVERHEVSLDTFLLEHGAKSQPNPVQNFPEDSAHDPATELRAEGDAKDKIANLQPGQRLYASGRMKLLAGDTQAALRDWEAALAADPSSLDLAGRVGVLQVRAGKRSTGLQTLRAAAETGLGDAEALRVLAREEARSGDGDRALELLVRAIADPALSRDEVQWWLAWTDLGERLGEAEYLNASRELLSKISGLEPQSFGSEAFRNQDFAELLRKRGALLLRAGDLGAMRGQWAQASDSYRAALASGALDESSARLRLAAVSLRAGNPADAALQVVESLPADQLVQPWHEEVADAVRADATVGPLLARAVRMEGKDVSATATARRVELAARCVPPAQAAQLLEQATGGYAQQERLLARLLDATDARVEAEAAGKPSTQALIAARTQALVGVLQRDPLAVVKASHALVRHGRDLNETLRALSVDDRPQASLLASALFHHLDQPARALEILDGGQLAGQTADVANLPPALQAGFTSARIASLAQLGRDDEAQAVARRFADQEGVDPWLAAQVLVVAHDHDAARDRVASLLLPASAEGTNPQLTVEQFALGAHLEALAGRRKQSLALLERAAALDPDAEFIADCLLYTSDAADE